MTRFDPWLLALLVVFSMGASAILFAVALAWDIFVRQPRQERAAQAAEAELQRRLDEDRQVAELEELYAL